MIEFAGIEKMAKESGEKLKFVVECGDDLFGNRYLHFFSGGEKVLDISEVEGEWKMFVKAERKPLKLAEIIKNCGDLPLENIVFGDEDKASAEVQGIISRLRERNLFS